MQDKQLASEVRGLSENVRKFMDSLQKIEARGGSNTFADLAANPIAAAGAPIDAAMNSLLNSLKESLQEVFKQISAAVGNIALGGGMHQVASGELDAMATSAGRRHTRIADTVQEMADAHSTVGRSFGGPELEQYQERAAQRNILFEENRRRAARATSVLPGWAHDTAYMAQDDMQARIYRLFGRQQQEAQLRNSGLTTRGE